MRPILRPMILFATLLALSLPLGCGGDGDGGTNPNQPGGLDGAALSVTSSAPMERIYVSGLPAAKATANYEVVFLAADGTDLFRLPLESPDDGLPWFSAPFHPLQPTSGGSVRLQIVADDVRSPERDLALGTLPAAPGSFQRYVDLLREHVDQRALGEGSSFDGLAGQAVEDVPTRLLPLKFAQVFVDDPGHGNSLARIADGTSTYLDATQRDLLDRMFGFARIDSVVQADIDHMTGTTAADFAWYGEGMDKDGCVSMGPTVATASQLSDAMQKAFEAKIATDPDGAPGKILGATGLALGAAAFVPGLGGVAAVAGAGLYAYQTSREYRANTYPSSFVSLTFDLDRDVLPEDEPGFARWSNVQVIAKSNGWVADKAIFEAVIQLVGAGLGAAQAGKLLGENVVRDAALADVGMGVGLFLDGQPNGVIEFCSQRWQVDITDLPFSEGRAVIGRVAVDTDWREIRPATVGPDVIKVSAVKEMFGYRTIESELPIETKEIRVTATPDVIKVRNPGEVVAITAEIEFADRTTLFWEPEQGSWNDGRGNPTNGPETRPLLTPADPDAYPFLVVIESTSRQGLRADGTPPRLDIVTVVHQQGEITVSPSQPCVANGERRQFTADVQGLDDTDVTWSLEPTVPGGAVIGSLSQAGLYIAPGSGSAEMFVVATSQADPAVSGRAYLEAGTCSCSWTLNIAADGNWAGDQATHGFPAQFILFSLTFGYGDPSVIGGGNITVLDAGPELGETGSWDCAFVFEIGGRAWAATGSDGTSATLTVFENDGQMVSEVSGTAITAINGQEFLRGFNLTVRSDDLGSGDPVCGED